MCQWIINRIDVVRYILWSAISYVSRVKCDFRKVFELMLCGCRKHNMLCVSRFVFECVVQSFVLVRFAPDILGLLHFLWFFYCESEKLSFVCKTVNVLMHYDNTSIENKYYMPRFLTSRNDMVRNSIVLVLG